jgi:hypothetical protein
MKGAAMAINENALAKKVTEAEGLKKVLSIADCKEVLRITLDLLACERPSEVLALLEKHEERML